MPEIRRMCSVQGCQTVFGEGQHGKMFWVRKNPSDPGRQVEICESCFKGILKVDEPTFFREEEKSGQAANGVEPVSGS